MTYHVKYEVKRFNKWWKVCTIFKLVVDGDPYEALMTLAYESDLGKIRNLSYIKN